jgi:hypothetical protein
VAASPAGLYVGWFHDYVRRWATWEPGDNVEPGTVGTFDKTWVFAHYRSLGDFGINYQTSDDTPAESDRVYASRRGFKFTPQVAGRVSDPPTALAHVGSTLILTNQNAHAFLLQIKEATSSHLLLPDDVLEQVRLKVLASDWDLDLVVVFERLKVQRGFAVICSERNRELRVTVDAGIGLMPDIEAYGGSIALESAIQESGLAAYDFLPGATPIFTKVMRVRQTLWRKLLRRPPQVINPAGGRYVPNLSMLPKDRRVYDPGASELSPEDVSALPVSVLFEQLDQPLGDRSSRLDVVDRLRSMGGSLRTGAQSALERVPAGSGI